MKPVVFACLLIGPLVALSGSAVKAIDLAELAPCKPAAARMCDRTGGMTWTNLLRCGATLAAHSWRVGNECRAVLRKYGQLCSQASAGVLVACVASAFSLSGVCVKKPRRSRRGF